jgi:hypothetical protein
MSLLQVLKFGSEPDTGFTAVRGNSIVEQADDPVDVFVDRDRQQAFVRGDSRLRYRDISSRKAVFGPRIYRLNAI